LSHAGVPVIFTKKLPETAPGLMTEEKTIAFAAARKAVEESAIIESNLPKMIEAADVTAETFVWETGLRTIRRQFADGWCYLLKNPSNKDFDEDISVTVDWQTAVIMDPITGAIGEATVEEGKKIRVQIPASGTLFLRTFNNTVSADPWQYLDPVGKSIAVSGDWSVKFVTGGPELPAPFTTTELKSWTKLAGELGEKFAGTASYSINVTLTPNTAGKYLLGLGKVADSARVFINGNEVAVLFAPPFQIPVELSAGENKLTVEVTNVAANRVRDLDRRKVKWQIFEDINFVGINFEDNKYLPFDASNWPVRDAGLLGPVMLQKLGIE
jgi:hypothetical protein